MNKKHFGTRLRMARKMRGLSQQQLADKLNISKQAVSKFERGLMFPIHWLSFSRALDVKPDFFLRESTVKDLKLRF